MLIDVIACQLLKIHRCFRYYNRFRSSIFIVIFVV